MVEIVNKSGQVTNVSQRKLTQKEQLKRKVESTANSLPTGPLESTAESAQTAFTDAKASVGGQIAGKIDGGIQNLTSKVDGYKNQLTDAKDTVQGLLSGDTSSLEGMTTDAVNNFIGSQLGGLIGTKVNIEYSDPDPETGIVTPITASLEPELGNDTVAGILSLITGLGASFPPNPAELADNFKGELQKAVVDMSPAGLLDAKDLVSGKIGAFTSDSIKDLSTQALNSVTDQIRSTVGNALASAANLNREITSLDPNLIDISSEVGGEVVIDTSGASFTTSGLLGGVGSLFGTDSANFNDALKHVDSDARGDIANTIQKSDEITQNLEGAKKDVSVLSGGKDGTSVINSYNNEAKLRDDYQVKVKEYQGLVQTQAKESQGGIIQGISNDTLTTIRADIKEFSPRITDDNIELVIAYTQGSPSDESKAIKILINASNATFQEARAFFNTLDSTITNATFQAINQDVFPDPYVIGSYQQSWKAGAGNPVFPYISSVEELEAEIKVISRKITDVVVHWTETHTNKNIGSEEINGWHLEAGLSGIGYHYVCRRDGSLQRGRPVNIEGQHTPDFDFESVGFIFVGGINAPTGTPNASNFVSAQSLTRSQINTFDHLCRAFYKFYPGIKFQGHNNLDVSGLNVDPGFDVPDYVLTRFGKTND